MTKRSAFSVREWGWMGGVGLTWKTDMIHLFSLVVECILGR